MSDHTTFTLFCLSFFPPKIYFWLIISAFAFILCKFSCQLDKMDVFILEWLVLISLFFFVSVFLFCIVVYVWAQLFLLGTFSLLVFSCLVVYNRKWDCHGFQLLIIDDFSTLEEGRAQKKKYMEDNICSYLTSNELWLKCHFPFLQYIRR